MSKIIWEVNKEYIYGESNPLNKALKLYKRGDVIAFDYHTLLSDESKYTDIMSLTKLHDFLVLIISDLNGKNASDVMKYMDIICSEKLTEIHVVSIFSAKKKSHLAKPSPGMYLKILRGIHDIEKPSFYYALNSSINVKFVQNLKIELITPEGDSAKLKSFKYPPIHSVTVGKMEKFIPLKGKELVIMIGPPGSGKSYYTGKYLKPHKYFRINRDAIKSMNGCIKLCQTKMEENINKIVIDNTNPSKGNRYPFITLAKRHGYKITVLDIDMDLEIARHNTYYRAYKTSGRIPYIPFVVYAKYKKSYEKPVTTEGFDRIMNLGFMFEKNDQEYGFMYF